jgi:hypothetical protein
MRPARPDDSLLQREDVAHHFLRIRLGHLGVRGHVPGPGAVRALPYCGSERRDCIPVTTVPFGDVGVGGTRPGFVISMAHVALVSLQEDLRVLSVRPTDREQSAGSRCSEEPAAAPTIAYVTANVGQ